MLRRALLIAVIAAAPLVGACDTRANAPGQPPKPEEGTPAQAPAADTGARAADGSVADARGNGESRNPVARLLSREPEYREVTIPAGTVLPLELQTSVASETSTVEDPVRATLRRAVVVNGVEAIPAGAAVNGVVTNARRSARVKGRAQVAFRFNSLQARDERVPVRTSLVARTAPATKKKDAATIGVPAAAGAVIGGVVGGGDGAAKGAVIGGAGGTGVVLATRGKEVRVPAGTNVSVRLLSPITVRVPTRR